MQKIICFHNPDDGNGWLLLDMRGNDYDKQKRQNKRLFSWWSDR